MSGQLEISRVIPTTAERIYNAFLNPSEHSALTGQKATLEPDGSLSALGGRVRSRTLQLATGRQIIQNWRTRDFPLESPDARLEIELGQAPNGTQLTLRQTGLPTGMEEQVKSMWNEYYLDRMGSYFQSPASLVRGAGETVAHVAEEAQEAIEEAAQKAKTQIKKAQSQVKKVVKTAQKQLKKAQKPLKKAQAAAQKGLSKARALARKAALKKPSKKAAPKKAGKKAASKKAAPKKKASTARAKKKR